MFNVLLATSLLSKQELDRLAQYCNIMTEEEVQKHPERLSSVNVMVIGRWPKFLDSSLSARLTSLQLVQSIFAGVDNLKMQLIPQSAIICSNAGAYSEEVAEHAVALLLSASHCITLFNQVDRKKFSMDKANEISALTKLVYGRKIGVLGYGGIGRAFAKMLRGFDVSILAYTRNPLTGEGSTAARFEQYSGVEGLHEVLRRSDALLVSLPLTSKTRGLIGKKELDEMKQDAIMVNVARGDIVDRKAMLEHLRKNPRFFYATDVGWSVDGQESGDPSGEFSSLRNYITTPHVAGSLSSQSGRPSKMVVDNVLRFIKGEKPINVVDRSEYAEGEP